MKRVSLRLDPLDDLHKELLRFPYQHQKFKTKLNKFHMRFWQEFQTKLNGGRLPGSPDDFRFLPQFRKMHQPNLTNMVREISIR